MITAEKARLYAEGSIYKKMVEAVDAGITKSAQRGDTEFITRLVDFKEDGLFIYAVSMLKDEFKGRGFEVSSYVSVYSLGINYIFKW